MNPALKLVPTLNEQIIALLDEKEDIRLRNSRIDAELSTLCGEWSRAQGYRANLRPDAVRREIERER